MDNSDRRSPVALWTLFGVSALAGIGLFFIPAFIIRPFRYQSPRALSLAMAVHDRAPLWTWPAAVLCVLLALLLWSRARIWGKIFVTATMLLVVFSTAMARQNYFEWMFHPIDRAQFEPASQSKLDSAEVVMALRFGNDARAYPISQMAYHHILNDWVGGVPVAVTY